MTDKPAKRLALRERCRQCRGRGYCPGAVLAPCMNCRGRGVFDLEIPEPDPKWAVLAEEILELLAPAQPDDKPGKGPKK